jgi:hypothetical protein
MNMTGNMTFDEEA